MLTQLLIALVTFTANSVVLSLFFSVIVLERSSGVAVHRDALKITLPGTILASIFIFLNPVLPSLMSLGPFSSPIDVGISVAGIIWVALTRRYCETDWLSAIVVTVLAVIIYTFVMLFAHILVLFLARSFL